MLVLVGSEKGGVGKSTIAAHAAVRLALTGKATVLIDCDPQLTSYRWTQQRAEHRPDAPVVAGERLAGDIRGPVAELARRYHHLVVDVGGADTKALRSGLVLANRLIIPSRVARRDIETLSHVASLVQQVRESRDKPLHARVVFNMTRALPNFWARIDGAAEAVRSLDLEVCPYPIVERLSYDDSQRHGGSVFEHTDVKAKAEMNRVLEALLSRRAPSPAPEES